MSKDNIADSLDALIRDRRNYAPFFDWPDKKLKEWDVVCELLRSMHAGGDCRYAHNVESVDDDCPDCVIRDSNGVHVGVEVTELVDQTAVELCERGEDVYREWSDQAVCEKIAQILKSKDEKARRDLYPKLILVIHTDEVELRPFRLFPILDTSIFPRPRKIDEAYLICSYEPTLHTVENPYPYTRLRLE